MNNLYERKAAFVKSLSDFYINELKNPLGIKCLVYILEENDEYVYVVWESQQKRFSVWGDSHEAIMKEFCKFMEQFNMYCWLPLEERICEALWKN